jgi:hypothetical protein
LRKGKWEGEKVDSDQPERIEEKSAANGSLYGNYSATDRAEFFNFSEIGVSSVSRGPKLSPRFSGPRKLSPMRETEKANGIVAVGFIEALTQRRRPVREKTTALAVS